MLPGSHHPRGGGPRREASTPLAPPRADRVRGARPRDVGGEASGPAAGTRPAAVRVAGGGNHPLTDTARNRDLHAYESRIKEAFDCIVPTLRRISALQHENDFEAMAQDIARERLGFELPAVILADAWVDQLDMRRLYAWCVFETYRRYTEDFFRTDPLGGRDDAGFQTALQECGFHAMDVTPCADGRLAHVVSYVLRLPFGAVRRKSYAGAMFDIEENVGKWVETELTRFREGRPNTADAPTRYLKVVVYHYSTSDPFHEGCAAHGSDTAAAARAGLERLENFQRAIENGFCCGASVDLLLVGMDTDSDAIRVHVPDASGHISLERPLDGVEIYRATLGLTPDEARAHIREAVRNHAPGGVDDGMARLVGLLVENNISQVDYVRQYHGGAYVDIGHRERFIGVGIGFEEVQLRNLTYFAYLDTLEEGAPDMDVGVKIFKGLNVSHGLPIPVVVRFDYHGAVPGALRRAKARCARVSAAIGERYPALVDAGLLHLLTMVRDCDGREPPEPQSCTVLGTAPESH